MLMLGIKAYHGDIAAALVADGRVVAAVEQECFRRVKHWAGFPLDAIGAWPGMAAMPPFPVSGSRWLMSRALRWGEGEADREL